MVRNINPHLFSMYIIILYVFTSVDEVDLASDIKTVVEYKARVSIVS